MVNAKNNYTLVNKTALVTGAVGLLGVEHCIALAALGAKVVVTDISKPAIEKTVEMLNAKFPGHFIGRSMDVTSDDSIRNCHQSLPADFAQIDILVNNAAIDPKVSKDYVGLEASRLENFSLESWNFQINVGLTGAMLCAKYFGPLMAERKSGVILNIASDLSVFSPDQRIYKKEGVEDSQQPVKPVTYSVIKHGLLGLTKYLATYWADKGVRCNALSPGGVYNNQPEAFVNKLVNLIPMGRMANHDEYQSAVQFLCSDASSYMNGQNLVIDGGRSVL